MGCVAVNSCGPLSLNPLTLSQKGQAMRQTGGAPDCNALRIEAEDVAVSADRAESRKRSRSEHPACQLEEGEGEAGGGEPSGEARSQSSR